MAPRMRRRITSAKREEIEKQQKALSQAIVRPFEVLSGLPLSYNPPPNGHYEDVLKNPLTTKDTGVLYRSLMKSRLNYMNIGPMFKLYWLKQSSYAKKMQQLDQEKNTHKTQKEDKSSERVPILGNDVSARDVMVKLCDASLSMGPHKFEIRLFIAKDERSEKNAKKKEDDGENKVKQDLDVNQELVSEKEKLGMSETTSNPTNTDDKIKENSAETNALKPSEEQDKSAMDDVPDTVENTKEGIDKESNENISQSSETPQSTTNEMHNTSTNTNESNGEQETNTIDNLPKGEDQSKTKSTYSDKPDTSSSKENGSDSDKKASVSDSENLGKDEMENKDSSSGSNNNANKSKNQNVSNPASTTEDLPTSSNPEAATIVQQPSVANTSSMPQSSVSTSQNPSPTPPAVSNTKNDPNSMQSIENTIMIANLNTIARVDQSLNALMKIVALGNASPQQIITFQGYIQRAREMGPQPHHAYLFQNGILPNQRLKKLPKDKKPPKEKKPPKQKVPKDQKLTAFQEKYLTDATLLFEFVENANVRYMLPQEAVCEVLPPATYNAEEPDNKDILVSFLWIHNQNEVDNYNQKLKEYKEFKKKEEEELNKEKLKKEEELKGIQQKGEIVQNEGQKDVQQPENEQKPEDAQENELKLEGEQKVPNEDKTTEMKQEDQNNEGELEPIKPSRRPPPRKGRRRRGGPVPSKKVVSKKIECPVEPEIKYTAISFTIHGIPSRYVPIVANSFKKLEDVQERMSYILKNGTRTASFYLWYQVDGKLDELIAEDVRVQLNHEEKKMQGVTSTQSSTSSAKKRKQKEKGSEPKPKKNKTELAVPTSAPIPVTMLSENQNHNPSSETNSADMKPSTDGFKSETSLTT